MDKFFGGRNGRRRLKRPAWWYVRGCSVPGCMIPLWPAGENLDDDGCDMRMGGDMVNKNISFSQICFLCQAVLCRYHLSSIIDFSKRWSEDFTECFGYPNEARLCQKCILDVEIEFIVFENTRLLQGDTFNIFRYRREYGRYRHE
jgi:hypothetical protein